MGIRKTIYREKRYPCGEFEDVYIYPVNRQKGQPSGRRRGRFKPSREVQEKLNQRHAGEKLARLAHANFTEKDLALELDFAENPPDKETALKHLRNFLRRIRRRYQKLKIELKYLWVMEVTQSGRHHFHLMLTGGMDRDEIEKLWGHGWANTKRLQFDKHGLTALSEYMEKSHKRKGETRLTYRSYNGSKNLIDPEPKYSDSHIESRKRAAALADEDWGLWAEMYPEYEVVDLWPFHSDQYGSIYIFARLHRTDVESPEPKKKRKRR